MFFTPGTPEFTAITSALHCLLPLPSLFTCPFPVPRSLHREFMVRMRVLPSLKEVAGTPRLLASLCTSSLVHLLLPLLLEPHGLLSNISFMQEKPHDACWLHSPQHSHQRHHLLYACSEAFSLSSAAHHSMHTSSISQPHLG